MGEAGKPPLFVYGTLMEPRVLHMLLDRVPKMQRATLTGYHRYRIRDRVYPGIRPSGDASGTGINGYLLLGLDDRERQIMDYFEDTDYDKCDVVVTTAEENDGNAREVAALVYVWNESAGAELYGTWDFAEHFLPHVESYLKMCQGYHEGVVNELGAAGTET